MLSMPNLGPGPAVIELTNGDGTACTGTCLLTIQWRRSIAWLFPTHAPEE
jgi:hypothetical protein